MKVEIYKIIKNFIRLLYFVRHVSPNLIEKI